MKDNTFQHFHQYLGSIESDCLPKNEEFLMDQSVYIRAKAGKSLIPVFFLYKTIIMQTGCRIDEPEEQS